MKRGGRKAGSTNIVTREARSILTDILNSKLHNLDKWIDEIAKNEPAKAVDLLLKLAEYVMPKLSRQEVKQEITNIPEYTIRIVDCTEDAPPLANSEEEVQL